MKIGRSDDIKYLLKQHQTLCICHFQCGSATMDCELLMFDGKPCLYHTCTWNTHGYEGDQYNIFVGDRTNGGIAI